MTFMTVSGELSNLNNKLNVTNSQRNTDFVSERQFCISTKLSAIRLSVNVLCSCTLILNVKYGTSSGQ